MTRKLPRERVADGTEMARRARPAADVSYCRWYIKDLQHLSRFNGLSRKELILATDNEDLAA